MRAKIKHLRSGYAALLNFKIRFLYLDLFCGAGGTSTGIHNARHKGNPVAKVIACVNHDALAIKSHAANHPQTLHYTEDILHLELGPLIAHIRKMQLLHPRAKLVLWASLECTNFSNAKGGSARDADSRTLAEGLYRYIDALNPDIIQIENVREFMAWGPLNKDNKPESRTAGRDYQKWILTVQAYGYSYDFKLLNSADYGAYTSRLRFFGMFAKPGIPIIFPPATHSKTVAGKMFADKLRPWKAVREVLNLQEKGASIFTRPKALSVKTLARVYAGLVKYVAGGDKAAQSYLVSYYSEKGSQELRTHDTGSPAPTMPTQGRHCVVQPQYNTSPDGAFMSTYYGGPQGAERCSSLETVCPVVPTENRHYVVQPAFISKAFSGNPAGMNISLDGPAGAATTVDHHQPVFVEQEAFLVQRNGGDPGSRVTDLQSPARTVTCTPSQDIVYMIKYFKSGENILSADGPASTLTTKDRIAAVQAQWLDKQYGKGADNCQNIQTPAHTVTGKPKLNLTSAEFAAARFVFNPGWFGHSQDIERPAPVAIARQDKAPLYLTTATTGGKKQAAVPDDSDIMQKIKLFCVAYGISDIYMRMLMVEELTRIQGFPGDYILYGPQTEQKKFLGNAVVPVVPERWVEALTKAITWQKQN